MSITVTADTISGSRAGQNASGSNATRVFRVETDGTESLFDILNDSNIPAYGELHPEGVIIALEKNVEPLNDQNTLFEVTVNYSAPDFATKPPSTEANDSIIQVGSSVSTTQTQRDKDDDPLIITLTGQPDQLATVDIQTPETVLVFERKEATTPRTKAIANTGKVNSASLGSGTYAARTLLCLGIEGTSTDNGATWQVVYRFQYNPKTWAAEAVYIDPETGQPHVDVDLDTPGAGWIRENIYPEADFSTLNLPF
jgi:hypothetical protein